MGYNFAVEVDNIAAQSPNRTAIFCVDQAGHEEKISYRELSQATHRLASGLQQLGVQKGDRALIILPRTTESFVIYLALQKLGATAIPGSEMLCAADIKYRLHQQAKRLSPCGTC